MPCLQHSDILISTCHFTFNHFPHSCTRFLLFIYSAVILLFWHSFLFEFLLFVDLWVISLLADLRFSLFFHFCCSPKCECHRSTVKTPRANFLLFPSTAIDLSFPPDLHRRCSLNDWSELAFFVTFKFSFFTQLLSLLCVEGKNTQNGESFSLRERGKFMEGLRIFVVSFIYCTTNSSSCSSFCRRCTRMATTIISSVGICLFTLSWEMYRTSAEMFTNEIQLNKLLHYLKLAILAD